jgi:hypothetical protein
MNYMANEHTLVYELALPVSVTCADGAGIEKGTLVKFADPNTVSAAAENDYIYGVTSQEKVASDGRTQIAVYKKGIFKATLAGSVTSGQALAASGSNQVKVAAAAHVGAKTLGIALETGTNGETILYELNPGVNNTAYA